MTECCIAHTNTHTNRHSWSAPTTMSLQSQRSCPIHKLNLSFHLPDDGWCGWRGNLKMFSPKLCHLLWLWSLLSIWHYWAVVCTPVLFAICGSRKKAKTRNLHAATSVDIVTIHQDGAADADDDDVDLWAVFAIGRDHHHLHRIWILSCWFVCLLVCLSEAQQKLNGIFFVHMWSSSSHHQDHYLWDGISLWSTVTVGFSFLVFA